MKNPLAKSDISKVVDAMLGKKFCMGGQGPDAFYCFGVMLVLLRECAGIELEDPFMTFNDVKVRELYSQFVELSLTTDSPLRPLDVIFYRRPNHDAHVSVVESRKWAVSCEDPFGPVRVLLCDEIKRGQQFYRHKSLV